jgi:D-3-phosphoglycerate dehydrogenase
MQTIATLGCAVGEGGGAVDGRVVAIVGTRYEDFGIEEAVLGPAGCTVVSGPGASADELVEVAGAADVIVAGSAPRFDAATIGRLRCRGIVRSGVGVETIDLDAAAAAGMWVARVADYGTDAVSLHAVTLALAGIRGVVAADRRVRSGAWGFAPLRPLHLPGELQAGVVGFGRIGRRTAELLHGLGFRVVAHDPLAPVDAPAIADASLEELLATSDVVSLHAPAPADGSTLIGAAELATMKEHSVLVNTARGALVDQDALVAALQRGRPATAALDVFASEPVDASIFAEVAEHVILTPHMAWYTEESERDLREKAAREALRLLDGERPHDVVVEPGTVPA